MAPGRISARRPVPAHIPRPEYVDKPAPAPFTGSEVKDSDTIERMRIAGRLAAEARDLVGSHVAPGITTDELDRIGHEFLCDHGAYPSTLGYKSFPKSLCSSVNEVVCHGIPDSYVVQDGDIVNIDITAFLNGVHGDTNATFLTPGVSPGGARPGRPHPRGAASGDQRGQARSADQRDRPGDRVLRQDGSATASYASSPATASARRSTPAWSSRTSTTSTTATSSSPA